MPNKDIELRRKYHRDWIAKRRNEFFADKHCVQCGSHDNLQLDHRDRSNKVSHKIWSWSKQRRLDEIAKCQVLCTECHKKKTIAENRYYLNDETAWCNSCQQFLPKPNFYKNRSNWSGVSDECKSCYRVRDQKCRPNRYVGASSNGKTAGFDPVNVGSIPTASSNTLEGL